MARSSAPLGAAPAARRVAQARDLGTSIDPVHLHRSIAMSSPASSGSDSALDDLLEKRQLVRDLVQEAACEGDVWYLVPRDYLDAILNSTVGSFEELKTTVGPVDCTSIVDSTGSLFPENNEPVPTYNVPPQLFDQLVLWFGTKGHPVSRLLIVNAETGAKEVERFPPYLLLHTMTSVTPRTYSYQSVPGISFSQTKTFGQLLDAIRDHLRLKGVFRLWFIELLQELPASIGVSTFIHDIPKKLLVLPSLYSVTLKSQGIGASKIHLLIETHHKSLQVFLVDHYLSLYNLSAATFESIDSQGGNLGLANLGNTCYMNLALQCLLHVPEINYYFLFNVFQQELNETNPLGNKGEIASTFGALLHKLFDNSSALSYVTPRDFKYTIGRYSSLFHGYLQQDSQEFLSWLLDALHEDLNRIYSKPYCEKPELNDDDVGNPHAIRALADTCWDQYKQRNDSVIVDLFTGLYQSTLVCPDCQKTSVTFDPFNDLTLPLPISRKWYHTFTVVDIGAKLIRRIEVELNKTLSYDVLLQYLSRKIEVPVSHLFLFEMFRNSFYKDFQEDYNRLKFFPISEIISDTDEVLVYVIPHKPDQLIVPVLNTVPDVDRSYNLSEPFGLPLFIVVDKQSVNSFGTIRRKLDELVGILTKAEIPIPALERHSAKDFPLLHKEDVGMDSDGYDSDVSLANPEVLANNLFTIKYYEDKLFVRPTTAVRIPRGRPNFNNLPSLASKLPELKCNYYHYLDYSAELDKELVEAADEVNQNLVAQTSAPASVNSDTNLGLEVSSPIKNDDFVLVSDVDAKPSSNELQSDTEGSEIGPVGLLFDSVSNLPPAYELPATETRTNHPELVSPLITLVCEWDPHTYQHLFNESNRMWEEPELIANPELEQNRALQAHQKRTTISLYDCLRSFSTPEVLGEHDLWYCPRCKDHKQATKTIQVWSTGDILTIHLKRFLSARAFSDKIDVTVDFPIEGLDMSTFVASENNESVDGDGAFVAKPNNLIYDLFAVDNHYGGLGGGHYTASVKNFRDNKWYYFNDGRVTLIDDPAKVVTGAAYLLFYRKRSSTRLGGEKVHGMITKGQAEYEARLREVHSRLVAVRSQTEAFTEAIVEDNDENDDDTSNTDESREERAKKSRLPVNEELEQHVSDLFNKRKQRLLSRSKHTNTSVHIHPGASTTTSTATSPASSEE